MGKVGLLSAISSRPLDNNDVDDGYGVSSAISNLAFRYDIDKEYLVRDIFSLEHLIRSCL